MATTPQSTTGNNVDYQQADDINRKALTELLHELNATTDTNTRHDLRVAANDLRCSIAITALRWLNANGSDFERQQAQAALDLVHSITRRGVTIRVAVVGTLDEIAHATITAVAHGMTAEHRLPTTRLLAHAA